MHSRLSIIALTVTLWGQFLCASEKAISPLADAVEKQEWQRVDQLLADKADLNAAQVDGMTSLHWAVFHDKTELTQSLIAAGADVTAVNRYDVTPLHIACLNGNGAVVTHLLAHGADANRILPGGETPLMTAARTGRPGPVKALLEHGAKVDARERKSQTAIMWSAAEGNLEVVNLLIEAGADFKTPLKSGYTPLFFAVREGRTDVVLRLLRAGLDVNDPMPIERRSGNSPPEGTTPLLLAVENGHFELAAKLLDAGADPNEKRTGYTALHALTWVRKPIRGDGDPPPIGSGKVTSLELVRLLVDHGADVNARHAKRDVGKVRPNKTDATPFFLAAETGDLPLLTVLHELGADPDLKNGDDTTPLLAASAVGVLSDGDESAGTEEDAIATIEYLLKLGADINAIDKRENTAMHGAAFASWSKLVTFLDEQGADIKLLHHKNNYQWTPLMIAQGHRPGNFRPSQETIAAIEKILQSQANTK